MVSASLSEEGSHKQQEYSNYCYAGGTQNAVRVHERNPSELVLSGKASRGNGIYNREEQSTGKGEDNVFHTVFMKFQRSEHSIVKKWKEICMSGTNMVFKEESRNETRKDCKQICFKIVVFGFLL